MNRAQQDRKNQFTALYLNAFPAFARYVSKQGGRLDEAKDIFQDALIVWYEKSTEAKTKINYSETAYVLGVAKYMWIKHYKSSSTQLLLDENTAGLMYENELHISQDKVLQFLETTGQKCIELLKSFYYDKLSHTEIAQYFGFSSERSATVQKYKCLEKVRNQVKEKSLSYADFID